MGKFFSFFLDTLAILVVMIAGALVVVIIAELILHILGGSGNKSSKSDNKSTQIVKDDDIVVYSNVENENNISEYSSRPETIDGNSIQEIDYDKAIQEQKMLEAKKNGGVVKTSAPAPASKPQPKPVEEPKNDMFWDNDEDDEFNKLLDEVVKEAKNSSGEEKVEKPVEVKEEPKKEESKKEEKPQMDEETKKELEELRALKEQQQKEIEEFKQMKEDFAREKEEQLAILKENINKAKEDELERLRQEAIKEQERLEKLQDDLEDEKSKLEDERAKLKEEQEKLEDKDDVDTIVKETIIKDEEELNRLKYRNLVRMNNRLTRIIRDTEKLQNQKQKALDKAEEERRKALEKQQEEILRERERLVELERQEQERVKKEQEAIQKRNEIERKLNEASKKAGKYKLDSKVIKISRERPAANSMVTEVIEEQVVTTTEAIPYTDTNITTVEKVPLKASVKPVFAKEYYEDKLLELEEELKEAEKELRANKAEYIPLTRIHKAYARDSEKLRKKEMQVAKQKVALYGVNSKSVDPAKKEKLDENLKILAELKDSVQHCEEVIKKNKDRYPIIEKNNQLITKQIQRINADIKVCEKAIEYYNK